MKLLFFFVGFPFIIGGFVRAQPSNSARISILSGGNVPFKFNSIADYVNGKSYTDWTTFSIEVVDLAPLPAIVSWTLDVEALQANIAGTGANFLLLSTLEIEATTIVSGCGTCALTGPQVLPPIGVKADLVTTGPVGAPPPSNEVSITYRCGTNTSLLGAIADVYTVDLQFTVKPCDAVPVCFDP